MSDGGESSADCFQNEGFDDSYFDTFEGPDFPGDPIGDNGLNSDSEPPSQAMPNLTTSEVPAVSFQPPHHRKKYGQGIDAKRTEIFRRYPTADSYILHQIGKRFKRVTRQVLLDLIDGALASHAQRVPLEPPTRNQKRVKAGLVAWIDDNAAFMHRYLRVRYGL
jgi:hypothetical protein